MMIAAFRNLKICSIVRRRAQTRCLGIVDGLVLPRNQEPPPLQRLLNNLHDTSPRPCADDGVRLRNLIQQLLPIALPKTARHDETAATSDLLIVCHTKYGRNGLFLRGLDECAGVDNQNICLCRLIRDFNAMLPHNAKHDLCVHEVLCTTETDKTCFH